MSIMGREAIYRALRYIALALLIVALSQALPFDFLAVAFAGDLLTYFEIAAAVWIAAQVTRVRWATVYMRMVVGRRIRMFRVRARRGARRLTAMRKPASDEDGPAFAFA